MASLRKSTVVVAFALVAVLVVGGAALAATVGRDGKAVTAVRTVTSDAPTSIESTTWTDVADMKTFVKVQNGQRAILIITFSAYTWCNPPSYAPAICMVRVTLDGQTVDPGEVGWMESAAGESSNLSVHSMQWVAGPVSAGEHQVKVQAAMSVASSGIFMDQRTLTVLRVKI